MSQIQTLKAAIDGRVRIDRAERIASARQDLGESAYCPAGVGQAWFDEFGRPASLNTIWRALPYSASCTPYTLTAQQQIAIENNTRPYINTCVPGLRGASDTLGLSRNLIPDKLYSKPARFVSQMGYPPADPRPAPAPAWAYEPVQPYSGSMDATSNEWVH